jgi:ribosomal protein L3 glutamine methyltransferase
VKPLPISTDPKRELAYQALVNASSIGNLKLAELLKIAQKLMRKAKLHSHFFGDGTLYQTALHLALFSLNLPYEYNNKNFLDKTLSQTETLAILNCIETRIARRIPIAYITHETRYSNYVFYVNEHVLVPRSIMNTRFEDFLKMVQWQNYRVLDLCTGSGCIGISLALLHPGITVDLVDISPEALEVAHINIQKYQLENRVQPIQSNLFENLNTKYDLIITNPPYVSEKDYEKAPEEFKQEPKIALTASQDGLGIIDKIVNQAKNYLNPEGLLIAEVGYLSAKLIKKQYKKIPLTWYGYRRPDGSQSWLAMDGIFLCHAKDLP